MNYFGLIMGAFMLVVVGLGHILVIKGEYHFGVKLWPIFLVIALSSISASIFVESKLISGIFGLVGFTFLFGIHELYKQKERVRKGWFPKKPQ